MTPMTPLLHVGIIHWLTLGAPLGVLSVENIGVLNFKDKFEPFTTIHILDSFGSRCVICFHSYT